MTMTQPNGASGTYRVPAGRAGELRMIDGAVFGDIVDRLGSFESLSMEPEEFLLAQKTRMPWTFSFPWKKSSALL